MNDAENIKTSNVLTVVVVDAKSQPTAGARVSIKPSDKTETTNSLGEARFVLGNFPKYDITATADGKTVTVPYYVTKNGSTRLVVNPVYVRTLEKQRNPTNFFKSDVFIATSCVLVVLVIVFVIWKKIKNKKPRIRNSQVN